ncbi:RrF2 family transcriptional regulator [Thermosipho atlanticus]|uniref:Transcriptional regulator, BadM/Rrf2 family n=1 Tax=Thermosipho atlanticus DSM 15807 TaxID=1123380 RepID=A0A1M5R5J8_9BACT|nr:Rrf2 family transcriptional regulator [Thermosipho atlanticus]SHH21448.1 transcriptional regulator, BadM/Rrf2 family [Thermosipho atlanticus DSM 15807]
MAVTMKSDYALRLLLLLSIEGKRLSTTELVNKCKTQIPYEFAQKILSQLVTAGILESYRGKFGGYKLSKDPKDITIYDVVSSVDDMSTTITCFVEPSKIEFPEICSINEIWEIVMNRFKESLKSVTLEDLKNSYLKKIEEYERRKKK